MSNRFLSRLGRGLVRVGARLAGARASRSLENPSTPLSAPDAWLYDALGGYHASSGVNVNPATALTYSAVWRAVNLISRDVAKLPLHVYRRGADGKRWDDEHPAYTLLRRKPNPYMTAFHFRQTLQSHALTEGNGYAAIGRLGSGEPYELVPLNPRQVYPIRVDGALWYLLELSTGEMRKLPADDVLHIKGLGYDGTLGYSVIAKARESLGLGMALETYGSVFFRNGARPSVIIKYPQRLSEKARNTLRESWERIHSGLENAHKTAILEEGADVKELTINARDSQLIEQRQFQRSEVANWFGIPPHKLGDDSKVAYNSLEQENQAYLADAIEPWLVTWEEECWDKLLTERQKSSGSRFVEFHRKSLIAMSSTDRANYFDKAVKAGWMSPDDVRAEDGHNPIPEGKGAIYYAPQGVQPAGSPPAPAGTAPGTPGATPAPAPASPAPEATSALIDAPDVRQPNAYYCGPAIVASALGAFGIAAPSLDELAAEMGTTAEAGTPPLAIIGALMTRGLAVTSAAGMDAAGLSRFTAAGHMVICPVQLYGDGHWVGVLGVALGQVIYQDPSAGRQLQPADAFDLIWNDSDASGARYDHFGIAVGTDPIATGPADEADWDTEGEDDVAMGVPEKEGEA